MAYIKNTFKGKKRDYLFSALSTPLLGAAPGAGSGHLAEFSSKSELIPLGCVWLPRSMGKTQEWLQSSRELDQETSWRELLQQGQSDLITRKTQEFVKLSWDPSAEGDPWVQGKGQQQRPLVEVWPVKQGTA